MAHIVGIRFHGGGKTYHFDASAVPEVEKGEYVIVETSRGKQLGEVVAFLEPTEKDNRNWKPILRAATSRDLVMRQVWEKKEQKMLKTCRKLAEKKLRIINIDSIIFAEAPKIGSYRYEMQNILAKEINIAPNGVNIKATTTEGLGVIGKGEGIGAMCVALLE